MELDTIELTGIEAYGYHGCLPQERLDGQNFYLDVVMSLELAKAGQKDDLSLTVNYAEVIDKVKALVAGEPVNLIEALAERIATMILNDYTLVHQVTICVHKPQAPVNGKLKDLAVRITRQRI